MNNNKKKNNIDFFFKKVQLANFKINYTNKMAKKCFFFNYLQIEFFGFIT